MSVPQTGTSSVRSRSWVVADARGASGSLSRSPPGRCSAPPSARCSRHVPMWLRPSGGDALAACIGLATWERITEPLGLSSTYFASDPTRAPIGGLSNALPEGDTSSVSYRALETAAGAAGALVSTPADLAAFLRALAHGQLLSASTFPEMTKGLPETGHSLGCWPPTPPSATGISNSGAIPAFTAYMQYDPATGDLLVLMLNDDTRTPEQLGTSPNEITAEALTPTTKGRGRAWRAWGRTSRPSPSQRTSTRSGGCAWSATPTTPTSTPTSTHGWPRIPG